MKPSGLVTVAQLADYQEIIDVRTPAEYAEDHIPGAINCPVLSDEERVRVGTLYKQVSPFEAKKVGAALIAINIARHLQERFHDRPKEWRPLIYCWRGGQRSGAMQIIFRQIGWRADKLEGGYKAYRGQVLETLETLPQRYTYQVLCGPTGSAKTRVLQAIGRQGGQILDLETLAAHKGSVLGPLPGEAQPAQKGFDTLMWQSLQALDPSRPVYVEAESRTIGRLRLPAALVDAMRASACVQIDASLDARVDYLLRDYAYFPADPAWLRTRLACLKDLVGGETLALWNGFIDRQAWAELVRDLLARHYDPHYQRSQNRNYAGFQQPRSLETNDLSDTGIEQLAAAILAG